VRQCPCDPLGNGATARTFLALNDSTAGFLASTDALVEITGSSGSLANLAVV
jgi:serralysin